MNVRSDFADTLFKALQDKGFKYFGKLEITDELFDSYHDLSPKSMADKYAFQFKLREKNNVLSLLQEIYKNNLKGIYCWNVGISLDKLNLSGIEYPFYFRNQNDFVECRGERKKTEYHWIKKEAPLFSDAEKVFEELVEMKKFSLNNSEFNFICKHLDLTEEEIYKSMPDKREMIKRLPYLFKIRTTLRNQKSKEVLKEKPKENLVTSVEIKRELIEKKEEPVEKTETNLKMGKLIFLMNKKMKVQEKIEKSLRKYIKKLERKILELQQ